MGIFAQAAFFKEMDEHWCVCFSHAPRVKDIRHEKVGSRVAPSGLQVPSLWSTIVTLNLQDGGLQVGRNKETKPRDIGVQHSVAYNIGNILRTIFILSEE